MARRPMSAATKAKIASSLKGNKNAYKHGGLPTAKNHRVIANHGYTKRRRAGVIGLSAASLAATSTGIGAPVGLGLAIAANHTHNVGKMKQHAKNTGGTLIRKNRKGQAKRSYVVPHGPRALPRKATKTSHTKVHKRG